MGGIWQTLFTIMCLEWLTTYVSWFCSFRKKKRETFFWTSFNIRGWPFNGVKFHHGTMGSFWEIHRPKIWPGHVITDQGVQASRGETLGYLGLDRCLASIWWAWSCEEVVDIFVVKVIWFCMKSLELPWHILPFLIVLGLCFNCFDALDVSSTEDIIIEDEKSIWNQLFDSQSVSKHIIYRVN